MNIQTILYDSKEKKKRKKKKEKKRKKKKEKILPLSEDPTIEDRGQKSKPSQLS